MITNHEYTNNTLQQQYRFLLETEEKDYKYFLPGRGLSFARSRARLHTNVLP